MIPYIAYIIKKYIHCYIKDQAQEWSEFKLHMLKIQKLMVDEFGIEAKANDQLAEMTALAGSLGSSDSAEND